MTVAGLNQLGAPFFVEPLFDGSMLILAVGLAVQAAQRRQRRGTEADRAAAPHAKTPGPDDQRSNGNPDDAQGFWKKSGRVHRAMNPTDGR